MHKYACMHAFAVHIVMAADGLLPAVLLQILMNVPFTAIHFSAYEAGKRALGEAGQVEGLWSELLAGGLAGVSTISMHMPALLPCCRTTHTHTYTHTHTLTHPT